MVGRHAASSSSSQILRFRTLETCHGFAHHYRDLIGMLQLSIRLTVPVDEDIGLRFLLGLAEAGLFPGIVFYLSW